MQLIASIDDNWGIGRDGQLLFRIREDLRRFRRLTIGRTVILGRKTMSTFPQALPLPDRQHVILSRSPSFSVAGAQACRSPEEVFQAIANVPADDVFLIGGESVYRLFLPYCTAAHITRVVGDFSADAHLPNLDQLPTWRMIDAGQPMREGDFVYRWQTYENVHPEVYPDV